MNKLVLRIAIATGVVGVVLVALAVFLSNSRADGVERLRVRVVREYTHDPEAFTQGLEIEDGHLYETTGLRGESSVRRVTIASGAVERKTDLPADKFGEGMTIVGDHIFQVTWLDGIAYVWNRETLQKEREIRYSGEGWGLCYDGTRIVMSNGSDRLSFRDPQTFEKIGEVRVRLFGRPLRHINELECVDGVIYANVWQREDIMRIDPSTGDVTATIDASGLLTDDESLEVDVLNGIAHREDNGHFLITGKRWPKLFEVEFVPVE